MLSTLSQLADNVQATRMEGNNSGTLYIYTCLAAIIVYYYYRYILHVVVPRVIIAIIIFIMMRLFRVSVRSFLPPRASRPRNIGTYVFIATRKNILFIIIVILAENALFTCKLRRHLLASMPLTIYS